MLLYMYMYMAWSLLLCLSLNEPWTQACELLCFCFSCSNLFTITLPHSCWVERGHCIQVVEFQECYTRTRQDATVMPVHGNCYVVCLVSCSCKFKRKHRYQRDQVQVGPGKCFSKANVFAVKRKQWCVTSTTTLMNYQSYMLMGQPTTANSLLSMGGVYNVMFVRPQLTTLVTINPKKEIMPSVGCRPGSIVAFRDLHFIRAASW